MDQGNNNRHAYMTSHTHNVCTYTHIYINMYIHGMCVCIFTQTNTAGTLCIPAHARASPLHQHTAMNTHENHACIPSMHIYIYMHACAHEPTQKQNALEGGETHPVCVCVCVCSCCCCCCAHLHRPTVSCRTQTLCRGTVLVRLPPLLLRHLPAHMWTCRWQLGC